MLPVILAHARAAPNKHANTNAGTTLRKCRIEFPLEIISTLNDLGFAVPKICALSPDESAKLIVKIHPCE
jgi:hypothetical protein